VFSRGTIPVHPEDERILAIIRELCTQLNYYKFNIQTISWKSRIGARRFPLDAMIIIPRFHVLQLSQQAMGRLSPDEWRPILASGLLYYKNLNRGMLKAIVPSLVAALLSPLTILADFKLLGNDQNLILREIILIPFFVILALGFFFFTRFHKRFYLENDYKASRIVGKESLTSSLTKLGSIDPNMTKGKRGFFRPSIQERIHHLTTFSQY
jgi:hypothetical protein